MRAEASSCFHQEKITPAATGPGVYFIDATMQATFGVRRKVYAGAAER